MGYWPVVKCAGSATERGRAYGTQAKESILNNIEIYQALFHERYGTDWAKAREWAKRFLPALTEFDPDLLQEMQAIADGSGVDILDILTLNSRSSFKPRFGADDCTSIAFLPAPGEEGTTILAQNWDNLARLKPVVLQVEQPDKPSLMTFVEAGMLAKMGLNSAGIALCVNGLFGQDEASGQGLPIFCLMRKALQASCLSDAIGAIVRQRRDAPHNYMFASKEGAAFDLEALTVDFDVLAPEGRFLVHTNHFLSPRIVVRDEGLKHPDTVVRLWRARQLLAGHGGRFGVAEMKTVLSDHLDRPGSICRHAEDLGAMTAMRTKCAIIMEPARGLMHVSTGNPCDSPLETFTLA